MTWHNLLFTLRTLDPHFWFALVLLIVTLYMLYDVARGIR